VGNAKWRNDVEDGDPLAYAWRAEDGGNYIRSYLVLDWGQREARIAWHMSSETAITFYEFHGHQTALPLPANVDARRLAQWLVENAARLELIAAGYESAWDGHNHVARFSPAASTLLDDLTMEADLWTETEALALPDGEGVWAASDWLYDCRHSLVSASSSDDEIAATAERVEQEARAEGIRVKGAADYLLSVREELRDEAAQS